MRVPEGVRASFVVFDRAAGRVVVERRPRQVFRSASLVKILMALDYMRERRVSAEDRALMRGLLRSSAGGGADHGVDGAGAPGGVTWVTGWGTVASVEGHRKRWGTRVNGKPGQRSGLFIRFWANSPSLTYVAFFSQGM